jgi:hypothetical protein
MSASGKLEGILSHYVAAFALLSTADELSRKLYGGGILLGSKVSSGEIQVDFQAAADRLVSAACKSGALPQAKAEKSFSNGWQKGLSGEGGKPVTKTTPLPFAAPAAVAPPTVSATAIVNVLKHPAVRAELLSIIADALHRGAA